MIRNSRSLGIVVELENIEASGADRALVNLRELQRQIGDIADALEGPIQFKVVYDSNIFAQEDADRFIHDTGIGANPLIEAESIGAPGIHYYEHKNLGAAHLDTDLILLMDSDILIKDGWLAHMLAPFDDETIHFVSGRTHIETPRFFDKIYALTDPGFPLRKLDEQGLIKTPLIMANAFAYRPDKVEAALFPAINAYRGHCGIASQALIRSGETLYQQTEAVALHPSQEDLWAYLSRAYAEGCDSVLLARYNNRPGLRPALIRSPVGSVFRLGRGIWGVVKRSVTKRDRVDLPLIGIPAVIALGMLYFGTRLLGEMATFVSAPLAMRFSIAKRVD